VDKTQEKNLKKGVLTRFNSENQPANKGRKEGKMLRTLIKETAERRIDYKDVVLGAKRKVTVNEAFILALLDCGLVKKEPWAIQLWLKEFLHDGVDKVEIQQSLSPAARAVLEKAGALAKETKIIDVSPD